MREGALTLFKRLIRQVPKQCTCEERAPYPSRRFNRLLIILSYFNLLVPENTLDGTIHLYDSAFLSIIWEQ